jgi:hypothetical protein
MRFILGSLPQTVVMAAIVDTALFLPFGAILAFLSFALFGVSLRGFITFGGALNAPVGLIAWWSLLLVPSLAYAAYAMPWRPKE